MRGEFNVILAFNSRTANLCTCGSGDAVMRREEVFLNMVDMVAPDSSMTR